VFLPFLLLIILSGATPVLVVADGPTLRGVTAVAAAVLVGLIGVLMRPGEGAHLTKLLRPWIPVALAPALWMMFQALPVPIGRLANPIWASAATALGHPVTGAVSIDPGLTLVGLGRLLLAMAIIFVAAALAIDRRRAEWMLFWLTGVSTLVADLLLAADPGHLSLFGVIPAAPAKAAMGIIATMGIILASAAAVHAIERYEIRRTKTTRDAAQSAVIVFACVGCGIICGSAIIASGASSVFAASCTVALPILIGGARRLGCSPPMVAVLVAAILLIPLSVVLSRSEPSGDLANRFASSGANPAVGRMLADAPLIGSGAGTFSALLPVYGATDDKNKTADAPTAAAQIAIELGRPALVLIILAAGALAWTLLRGAMLRGRDDAYPAAAASCIVLMVIEGFIDSTLLNTAVVIILCSVIGLGLGQSVSRSLQ
jgi:hypothetical protein